MLFNDQYKTRRYDVSNSIPSVKRHIGDVLKHISAWESGDEEIADYLLECIDSLEYTIRCLDTIAARILEEKDAREESE